MNNLLLEYNNGRLYNHRYANCHLEVQGDFIVFVSYETPILFFKRDSKEIHVKFDKVGKFYSKTTARHVTWALHELTCLELSSSDLYDVLRQTYKNKNLSKREYLESCNRKIVIHAKHEWSY